MAKRLASKKKVIAIVNNKGFHIYLGMAKL